MGVSFLVSTLPGWPDRGVLGAAARAGATGILNLEWLTADAARDSLRAVLDCKSGRTGARLADPPWLAWLPGHQVFDAIVATASVLEASEACARLRTAG